MYTGGRHFRQPSTEHNAATGKGPMRQTFRALILAAFVCVLLAGSFSDAQTRPEHASARSRIEARRQRLKNVIAEEGEFERLGAPVFVPRTPRVPRAGRGWGRGQGRGRA